MKISEEQGWQIFLLVVLLQPSSQTILITFFYPKRSVYNILANYHLLISKNFLLNGQYWTTKEKSGNIVEDVQN